MSQQTHQITLLLVDDHAMFREGLARMLEQEADLKVVGQCTSTTDALSMLHSASVVLLDVDLGRERALEFVEAAKSASYSGYILVVTAGITGQEAVQLVHAGVAGILHKHHSTQILCDTIRKVAAGEACLESQYLTPLSRSVDQTRVSSRAKLTDRDRSVLRYIFQGLSNRDIGVQLQISEGAVKASLRQLFEKLGVRTRAQLVKVAIEHYRDQL